MKPPNLNFTDFAKVQKLPNPSKPAKGKGRSFSDRPHCTIGIPLGQTPQSIVECWVKEAWGLKGGKMPPLPLIVSLTKKCHEK